MGCGASSEPPPKKGFAFRVRLIGGLNLYNNGFGVQLPGTKTTQFNFSGKSDPFVQFEMCGEFKKSRTVLHEQNPVWNEDFYFNVPTKKPVLKMKVFDADAVGVDDCIGTAEVNLHGLIEKKEREIWIPLEGARANGEIGLSIIECYRMKVTAKSGVDVKPMDSLSGSSDCYMTIGVGQQERAKTAVKGWTLNPVWNQQFQFFAPYGTESQLELILWDHDTVGVDSNMGWYYHKLDGKPQHQQARLIKANLVHAQGHIEIVIEDDTAVEAEEDGPVTDELKKKFPPSAPQTCNFQCRVLGAYNLAAADHDYLQDFLDVGAAEFYHEYRENTGTSDPFARIECEGLVYDTQHINNTLEPWWNQKFRFVARSREESELKVKIFDHDIVANDCIGGVTFPLNQMKPGENTEIWSYLDKGRGEVGLELQMDFHIKVKVVEGLDFPAKDLNGMCDPYVKLTIGAQTYQTRVCRDNRSPWIDEDFRWSVPTVKDQKLQVEVWDSDLMFFKKGLSEDLIGRCELNLENLTHGIPHDLKLTLKNGDRESGTIRIQLVDEIPLPPSALDQLQEKGKEAFEAAVAKLTDTKQFLKTLKEADYEKKEEAEIEPCDPKFSNRPRYSRIAVDVVAFRGLKECSSPMYVGVQVPIQGERYKSKEYKESANPDIGETFNFRLPTKTTSSLDIVVFESNKHFYTDKWSERCHSKATLKIRELNGGDGPVRGSPADDLWLPLDNGGEVCVRVRELFCFNVKVLSGSGLNTKTDPYVIVSSDNEAHRTSVVSKDPSKDRTEGIPGKPIWNEQFTFFAEKKGQVKFRLMDSEVFQDSDLGTATFDFEQVRRGVPKETTVQLDKGGELTIWIKEEEKMGLFDRIIDGAANAAKLAAGLVGEVADKVADKAGEAVGNIGNAIGGLFGK